MSATGRGAERNADDFYETPAWCVRRYLDFRALTFPSTGRWLEPSAGRGAIIRAVHGWCENQCVDGPKWMAVELNEALAVNLPQPYIAYDFLKPELDTDKKFDFCIGNPPYKFAREFTEKALSLSHEVAFLLRLNFLESEDRYDLFQKHPCDVRVLPNRPSFRTDGHTDATAYAWFEFGEGHGGRISVLGLTPKDERKTDRV